MKGPGVLMVKHNLQNVNMQKYSLRIIVQTTNHQASQYYAWIGYTTIGSQNPKL